MPKVPTYQPGQVRPVQTTGARFQAPDNAGGLGVLAQGFSAAAKVLEAQDKFNAENDDTQSRFIAADSGLAFGNLLTEYKQTEGGAARAGQEGFEQAAKQIWDNALSQAKEGRQRQFVEQRLRGLYRDAQQQAFAHAAQGAKVERSQAFDATGAAWAQQAVNAGDDAQRDNFIASGVTSVLDKAREIDGVDINAQPEIAHQRALAYTALIHQGAADKFFAQPEVDVVGANQYYAKYQEQMTPAVRAQFMQRLQGPLQERAAMADRDHYLGLAPAGAAPDVSAPQQPVAGFAQRVKITVTSESAGNPNAVSPKGATGRMQVMPATARDPGYGIRASNGTPEDTERVGREKLAKMEDRYGGDFAKAWGAYNWGEGNVDKAVKAYGDNWLDHAPAETKAYVRKNIAALGSAGNAYSPAPRDWSADRKQSAFAAIDKDVDAGVISLERGKRAKAAVETSFKIDEGLLADKRRDADEAATTLLANSGESFRTSMIPRSTWNALAPEQQIQFQSIEKKLTDPKPVEANGETVVALHRMAASTLPSDRSKFIEFNLAKARPYMTAAEFDEIATAQAKAKDDLRNPGAIVSRSKIDSAITKGKHWDGIDIDTDPTEAFRVRRYMEERAARDGGIGRERGRDLTDQDYERYFRDATRAVRVTGMLGMSSDNTKRSSQLLSPNYRGLITRSFRRANGRDPSEAEVQKAWEAMGAPAN